MNELERILKDHAMRYPLMEPTDAVKLIYQNEFGGGHLIRDEQAVRDYLHREYAEIARNPVLPRYESIGNGLVRVHLAALNEADLDPLAENFVRSAASHRGSLSRFLKKLDVLRRLTADGIFGFDTDGLNAYLNTYASVGYPMVSHSETYRNAYRPAYRVVSTPSVFEQAAAAIDALLGQKPAVTVAIDGRCGSGKTTLAAQLQAHYDCTVIPMDHFFLRRSQRTAARLEMPGENVDHERFLEEVLLPLGRGESFSYRPFDCSRMELAAPVTVTPGALTVIEGSYSCHPELWKHYDLRFFLTVDPEEQMRRITARNGAYAKVFQEKWIPLEERYFTAFDLENRCDFVLHT